MPIVWLSRPVTEGRLIKRLQTRGGERWPGWERRRCGAVFPSRRPKPHGSWRESLASLGSPTAHPPKARRAPTADSRTPNGGESMGDEPNRRTDHHRGPCGASLKHRARDALGFGGLAEVWTSTSLDVARCRGPRALRDLWRPARPRFFSGRAVWNTAYPGPLKEYGRWRLRALPSPSRGG